MSEKVTPCVQSKGENPVTGDRVGYVLHLYIPWRSASQYDSGVVIRYVRHALLPFLQSCDAMLSCLVCRCVVVWSPVNPHILS